jgi:hypothetical protein
MDSAESTVLGNTSGMLTCLPTSNTLNNQAPLPPHSHRRPPNGRVPVNAMGQNCTMAVQLSEDVRKRTLMLKRRENLCQ